MFRFALPLALFAALVPVVAEAPDDVTELPNPIRMTRTGIMPGITYSSYLGPADFWLSRTDSAQITAEVRSTGAQFTLFDSSRKAGIVLDSHANTIQLKPSPLKESAENGTLAMDESGNLRLMQDGVWKTVTVN